MNRQKWSSTPVNSQKRTIPLFTFLKEALVDIRQTGSVVESSIHLCHMMTEIIDFTPPLCLLELGAGTGCMTHELLMSMCPDSRLTSFEINGNLAEYLQKIKDHRLTIKNENALAIHQSALPGTIDYIVSSLPLSNMPLKFKLALWNSCIELLKPGGYYIQFQYSLQDHGLLRRKFSKVKTSFTLLNLPPAFVYYAKKSLA